MRSSSRALPYQALAVAAAVTALALPPASAAAGRTEAAPAPATPAAAGIADKPYMGWSSWSLQSTTYPGVNPKGKYSFLTEANVLKQAGAMAAELKKYGYEYVNMDAGWWMTWDWKPGYDAFGRQKPDPQRFPRGMKYVADRIHSKGLKAGIYLPVGLEKPAYGGGNVPIWNAPGCTTRDIVHPDLRTTNGWDSSYKIDFSRPCAQKYIDSQARQLADWGYDFLKLDGVGPGSFKQGENYDNRADVAAWKQALARTGRPVHLELSWSLDIDYIADWKRHSNGWRIDTDVECYCETLVTWTNSVDDRWKDAPAWAPHAGPGGWNDFDAVDVGNGAMDGLTRNERRSYMTLWAISAAPLYTGDDLTRLDSYGLSLLTNREVIAVDQQGIPARRVSVTGDRQVWGMRNRDGSYTVALFNLGGASSKVTARWSDFGFSGKASVRDLWTHEELGSRNDKISATVPVHGSRLFKVTPENTQFGATADKAESRSGTLLGRARITG